MFWWGELLVQISISVISFLQVSVFHICQNILNRIFWSVKISVDLICSKWSGLDIYYNKLYILAVSRVEEHLKISKLGGDRAYKLFALSSFAWFLYFSTNIVFEIECRPRCFHWIAIVFLICGKLLKLA